jgi:hypothetical protein
MYESYVLSKKNTSTCFGQLCRYPRLDDTESRVRRPSIAMTLHLSSYSFPIPSIPSFLFQTLIGSANMHRWRWCTQLQLIREMIKSYFYSLFSIPFFYFLLIHILYNFFSRFHCLGKRGTAVLFKFVWLFACTEWNWRMNQRLYYEF